MRELLIIAILLCSTAVCAQTACETPQMACEPIKTVVVPETGAYCTPDGVIQQDVPVNIERKVEIQIRRTIPTRTQFRRLRAASYPRMF